MGCQWECRIYSGTPWIKVNKNYKEVNAEKQVNDPDSVFSYYKQLIRLRHENEIIVYGDYELLEPDSDEVYIYTRHLGNEHLMIMCNFTDHDVDASEDTFERIPADAEKLIGNYKDDAKKTLRPYEAKVYKY